MLILAADTSTSINTVALCAENRILAETTVDCGRAHSERLIETIDWVLREAGVALRGVDLLAISSGPGSFTGLRVGVAAFKGLALAAELPLVAVPTLDALMRHALSCEGVVCPLIDARMKEVFGAAYRVEDQQRQKLTADLVAPVESVLEYAGTAPLVLGDGATVYRERILAKTPGAIFAPPYHANPRASLVAFEAMTLIKSGASTDPAAVSPVYLRKSQAEEAKGRQSRQGRQDQDGNV